MRGADDHRPRECGELATTGFANGGSWRPPTSRMREAEPVHPSPCRELASNPRVSSFQIPFLCTFRVPLKTTPVCGRRSGHYQGSAMAAPVDNPPDRAGRRTAAVESRRVNGRRGNPGPGRESAAEPNRADPDPRGTLARTRGPREQLQRHAAGGVAREREAPARSPAGSSRAPGCCRRWAGPARRLHPCSRGTSSWRRRIPRRS